MLDWKDIDTVLLDMDGTILNLHFDNYFWEEFVPARHGELHGLSAAKVSVLLRARYENVKGTLEWYSLHFCSDSLALNIPRLKERSVDSKDIQVDQPVSAPLDVSLQSLKFLRMVLVALGLKISAKHPKSSICSGIEPVSELSPP